MGTPLTGVAYCSPAFLLVERMSPTCTRQPARDVHARASEGQRKTRKEEGQAKETNIQQASKMDSQAMNPSYSGKGQARVQVSLKLKGLVIGRSSIRASAGCVATCAQNHLTPAAVL